MVLAKKIALIVLAVLLVGGGFGFVFLRPKPDAKPAEKTAPEKMRPSMNRKIPITGVSTVEPAQLQIVNTQPFPDNPLAARDAGYREINALQTAGQFNEAATYALAGPETVRTDLVITAYHEWGRSQPEQAFLSATKVEDPAAHEIALQAALSGWARTDPESLAELAINRPEGPERTAALTKAMRAWLNKDPWKAGDWIASRAEAIPIAEKMFRDDRR